jgi:hypothetical protein
LACIQYDAIIKATADTIVPEFDFSDDENDEAEVVPLAEASAIADAANADVATADDQFEESTDEDDMTLEQEEEGDGGGGGGGEEEEEEEEEEEQEEEEEEEEEEDDAELKCFQWPDGTSFVPVCVHTLIAPLQASTR